MAEQEPKKGIRWDEEVIAEHDKHRGQCQKIDEPKTPYEYLNEEELKAEEQEEAERQAAEEAKIQDSQELIEELEKEQKRRAFAEKRKNHYNEFEMVKAMRAKAMQEEDEEEDN